MTALLLLACMLLAACSPAAAPATAPAAAPARSKNGFGIAESTNTVNDPLRRILGWGFTVFENKYWVDELYKAVIVDPYVALSRWLAEVIDWRFWHDFFHDVIIAGGYNLLTRLLAVQIDLGGIDRLANGLAEATQRLASSMRRIQTGLVRNYALSVMLGVVLILGYLILR